VRAVVDEAGGASFRGEVLVSENVKQQWHGDGVAFQPIGPVALTASKTRSRSTTLRALEGRERR
jgi:hypothetical protein